MTIKRQSLFLGLFILVSFMVLQLFIGMKMQGVHHNTQQLMQYLDQKEQLKAKAKILTQEAFRQKQSELDTKINEVSATLNNAFEDKRPLFIILVINIFVNLGLYLFSHRIVHNLQKVQNGLNSFFSYLRREGKNVEEIHVKGSDEFSEIARNINQNIKEIEENLKKDQMTVREVARVSEIASKGDLSQRITSHASNPEINQLKESLNRLFEGMQKNLEKIVTTLVSYERAEYHKKIDIHSEGELKSVIRGVNNLGKVLQHSHEKIDTSLKNKSMQLNDSADKLRYSVKELFKFIKVESNNSQKVSSQIHNMGQKIQETALKAKTMKANALETTKMAQEGEVLADKTFGAMQEINTSTEAINEAITAIDSIAFQTNILSLNAAVEAATAGDAGKGFAVVAQEVRNLAAKSSEAARRIKELVENTQEKAYERMQISENMKESFVHVNDKIEETYKLVDSVTDDASQEGKMVEGILALVEELQSMTVKNSEVAKTTDMISGKILTIARDLQDEVETTREKVEV